MVVSDCNLDQFTDEKKGQSVEKELGVRPIVKVFREKIHSFSDTSFLGLFQFPITRKAKHAQRGSSDWDQPIHFCALLFSGHEKRNCPDHSDDGKSKPGAPVSARDARLRVFLYFFR